MKETPILFNTDMVRAILSGRKTQTRRLVKHIPGLGDVDDWRHKKDDAETIRIIGDHRRDSPFGIVGDRLWVREKTRVLSKGRPGWREAVVQYEADKEIRTVEYPSRLAPIPVGKCLANGCYREASRLTLEITGVNIERLQDITKEGAKAEGFNSIGDFAECWNSIYKNWQESPWVWVIEFKVV